MKWGCLLPRRNNTEERLQKAAISWLRGALPFTISFHIPNGGKRGEIQGARLKAMGVLAGVPDIALFWLGGVGFIELKTTTGRLQPNQQAIIEKLNMLGVHTAVCRGLCEVENTVREWGLKPEYPANKAYDAYLQGGGE